MITGKVLSPKFSVQASKLFLQGLKPAVSVGQPWGTLNTEVRNITDNNNYFNFILIILKLCMYSNCPNSSSNSL